MPAQSTFTTPGSESQALAIPESQSPEIIDGDYTVLSSEEISPHVCPQPWNWVAIYEDGYQLFECPGNDNHLAFANIDIERTVAMVIIPNREGLPVLSVKRTGPDWRPIFFRRHQTELAPENWQIVGNRTIHCLGFQRTMKVDDQARNVLSFTFVFEDGSILISDDRNAV